MRYRTVCRLCVDLVVVGKYYCQGDPGKTRIVEVKTPEAAALLSVLLSRGIQRTQIPLSSKGMKHNIDQVVLDPRQSKDTHAVRDVLFIT